MVRRWILAAAMGATLAGWMIAPTAAAQDRPAASVEATAQTLVNQCASIKEGELVLISGTPRDTDLLESIAVNVRKLGAFPLISLASDRLARRMYDDVPAKFDSQANDFALKLAGLIAADISIESTDNQSVLADIAPERLAATAKARQPVMDAMLKRNVRQVSLGNGLYPTAATAKLYGLTPDDLGKIFWTAVNTDYARLEGTGATVQGALSAGKEIHLTNPNGTDLKFRIEGRVFVSDGVISTDDVAKGGAACQVWLPAGEVYTAPVAGTAEGKVVIDRNFFQGKEITGLTLTFKAGKLTEMTAKAGLEPLKALYDASGPGKDTFGFVDIGINESMTIPQGSKLLSWIPAGMVSIGVGNNTWAGGSNSSSFDLSGFLPGSTLTVDGKAIVDKGTLKR